MSHTTHPKIQIQFNGQSREIASEITIQQLLVDAGIQGKYCAVELNLEIVPRDQYPTRVVNDGDSIEVVTLVGGG